VGVRRRYIRKVPDSLTNDTLWLWNFSESQS
jgi:hypothetical protein